MTALLAALALAGPITPCDDVTTIDTLPDGVRIARVMPAHPDAGRAWLLVVYATPNGSTAEETLGRRARNADEWHFDIQHAKAQMRAYAKLHPNRNVALAVVQAPGKSWPAWRSGDPGKAAAIREMLEAERAQVSPAAAVALTCHSGGGAFVWGVLDAYDALPDWLERIALLDANYSYSDAAGHGDKMLKWLDADKRRRLVVIAYDDRTVTYNGKLANGPDGGTYRATERMRARIERDRKLAPRLVGDFDAWDDTARQIAVRVNRNYPNRILHTALVGDMNGLLFALDYGAPAADGVLTTRRAHTEFIDPLDDAAPLAPPRPRSAMPGPTVMRRLAESPKAEREGIVEAELRAGKFPDFLRCLRRVTYRAKDAAGKEHEVALDVMPDYLAVGSDDDFCRIPMTPRTAQRIADALGCALPTPKLVDEIARAAEVKLEPRPLTDEREAVTTFVQHNAIVEEQRRGKPLGPIVAGAKKDIVLSKLLAERPGRVAIYGWHRLDGKPIQPVTTVHAATYVDYSHGVRLVRKRIVIGGVEADYAATLRDANLAPLLSDEGALPLTAYPEPAR